MHMADALLSPMVGGTMAAVSVGAIAWSVSRIRRDGLDEKRIPMMGVLGAFVFAAQMINFTIPGTGSSGHIGGGILLAAVLGGYPALLAIASVLIIQSLFFADGGLLALGCNIFNLGVCTCLIGYPLIFRPLIQHGIVSTRNEKISTPSTARITLASVLAVIVSLQLGSLNVVLETCCSGVTELPFQTFLWMMQPIHLAIGLVEGLITASVLVFMVQMRPSILADNFAAINEPKVRFSYAKILAVVSFVTLVTGGFLSYFASENPDGLEWAMDKVAGTTELPPRASIHEEAAAIQQKTAFMPDYDFTFSTSSTTSDEKDSVADVNPTTTETPASIETLATTGTGIAGVSGSVLTLLLTVCTGFCIAIFRKKHDGNSDSLERNPMDVACSADRETL